MSTKLTADVLLEESLLIAEVFHWDNYCRIAYKRRAQHQIRAVVDCLRTEKQLGTSKEVLDRLASLVTESWRLRDSFSKHLQNNDNVHSAGKDMIKKFGDHVESLDLVQLHYIDNKLAAAHRAFAVLGPNDDLVLPSKAGDSQPHEFVTLGLALSGGGIRSASFSLGALQAIAKKGLLPAVHYLSGVSGGGYAASWLCAWAYRHKDGIDGVQKELHTPQPGIGDAGPVRWFRRYGSYLAPRFEMLSSDSWALLVAYLRNWVPILVLVLCSLIALLLFPHLLVMASATARQVEWPSPSTHDHALLGVVIIIICIMAALRRVSLSESQKTGVIKAYTPYLIGSFAMLVCFLLATIAPQLGGRLVIALEPLTGPVDLLSLASKEFISTVVAWIGLYIGAVLVAIMFQACVNLWSGPRRLPYKSDMKSKERRASILQALYAATIGGAVGGVLMSWALLGAGRINNWTLKDVENFPQGITLIASPVVVMSIFGLSELASLLFVKQKDQADFERALVVRIGAWIAIGAALWTFLFLTSIGAPALFFILTNPSRHPVASAIIMLLSFLYFILCYWTRSGAIGAFLRSVALCAAVLFIISIFFVYPLVVDSYKHPSLGPVYFLLFIAVAFFVGRWTEANRFSLHAIYKEGLVRTFLGASRLGPRNVSVGAPANFEKQEEKQFSKREPDQIANIDEDDNPRLSWLMPSKNRPLPLLLLNAAVNGRSHTDNDGRVPRQWPFTFTPLYCGSAAAGLGYVQARDFFCEKRRRDIEKIEGGITVGTAMAISGAAVSPASGKQTNALRAFLLGVLNARLGLWVGNPCRALKSECSPRLFGWTILKELVGIRACFGDWIHLSDGGHFENLGIYELVRRGCTRIIAVDASCDPNRNFSDLANAIRRIQIDLGVAITKDGPFNIGLPDAPVVGEKRDISSHAWFSINYGPELPAGRLLYIKPSVYKEEELPIEISQYWSRSTSFPHESTADQFFGETQMEAYRSLGFKCALQTLDAVIDQGASAQDTTLQLMLLKAAKLSQEKLS